MRLSAATIGFHQPPSSFFALGTGLGAPKVIGGKKPKKGGPGGGPGGPVVPGRHRLRRCYRRRPNQVTDPPTKPGY